MSKKTTIQTMLLDGGCICFNFVNTVHSRMEDPVRDYLKNYGDFIDWMERVNLISINKLKKIKPFVKKNENDTKVIFDEIIEKRELLYLIFSSIIHERKITKNKIEGFNLAISNTLKNLRFQFNSDAIEIGWNDSKINLREPLWVIFKDAFDILTSGNLNRVKECSACGWLFIDKTKNNSRTWCNMKTCGSIDKAKRYYYKNKRKKL